MPIIFEVVLHHIISATLQKYTLCIKQCTAKNAIMDTLIQNTQLKKILAQLAELFI